MGRKLLPLPEGTLRLRREPSHVVGKSETGIARGAEWILLHGSPEQLDRLIGTAEVPGQDPGVSKHQSIPRRKVQRTAKRDLRLVPVPIVN
jgi:hypothetical protein